MSGTIDPSEIEIVDSRTAAIEVTHSAKRFTPRNKKNIATAAAGLILMRVWDVSEGDWEKIQPAVQSLIDLLWPVISLVVAYASQQFMTTDD